MDWNKTERWLLHAWALLFFVYAFLLLLKPVADPDLFWHLKTGEMIVVERSLPSEDRFSYTTTRPLTEGQIAGIRSQWLGQVVFYLIYAAGGYTGLSLARTILILTPFILYYVVFTKRGLHPLHILPVIGLPIFLIAFSLTYAFERPQAFSFLLSIALLLVLTRLRNPGGRLRWGLLLMLIMALWSNLHGGFIIGVVLIAVFSIGVIVEALITGRRGHLRFLLLAGGGILLSGANPNTFHLTYSWFSGISGVFAIPGEGGTTTGILEFTRLWVFYQKYHYIWPLFMIIYIAMTGAVVIMGEFLRRKVDVAWVLALGFFAFFGLYYSRGITLALAVLPVFYLCAVQRLKWHLRTFASLMAVCVLGALIFITAERSPWQIKPSIPSAWVDPSYPEDAVRFIEETNIKGPMFNELRWGGYIAWRLYPGYQNFIDGRLLDSRVLDAYAAVKNAQPEWQGILDLYRVNFILTEVFHKESGTIPPMVLRFLEERPSLWRLVFFGGNSALFVRNTEENSLLINRYGLPFEVLYAPIAELSEFMLRLVSGHPEAMLSRAIALYGLGRYEEARGLFLALPPSSLRDMFLRKLNHPDR